MSIEDERLKWMAGETESLRLGGYGDTIYLEITASGVRVRTVSPRRQEVIGRDTREVRELALQVADAIQGRKKGGVRAESRRRPRLSLPGILTPRDIWLAFLGTKLQPLPQDILDWGRRDLTEYYASLEPEGRSALPSVDTLNNILTAARALDRERVVPFDCEFDGLTAGDLTRELQAWTLRGRSVSTVKTYWRRFRWAVLEYQAQWPQRWGQRTDPTAAVRGPKKRRGGKPGEVGEVQLELLADQLLADREWRAGGTLLVARASGRRVGVISGYRQGLHLDAPPLTASDFERDEDGRLLVTWRAAVAKGGNYGRGDEVQLCPRELEVVYRWLTRFHPNPCGREHPLLWDENDPTRAASYDSLTATFDKAWLSVFGKPKPKGVAWHAIIRTTVTTIAEEAGVLAAAVHTGREVETVERRYVVRRQEQQEQAVALLDRRRRNAGRQERA